MEPSKIIFGSTEANPHRLEQAKLQRGTIDSRTHSVKCNKSEKASFLRSS